MTMNNIFSKLRKHNKGNYRQFVFCITFAVLLITSFAATMFSPTIQNSLEDGGDSRKMVGMIFAIAIVGCLMFSVYATGLFLKYKSKETGVFLALGTPKNQLSKALYTEMIKTIAGCTIIGITIGFIISFAIWQGFRIFIMNSDSMKYQFTVLGIVGGLVFSIVIGIIVLGMTIIFMKRSNLIDILNDERKNEPVGAITRGCGVSGFIFLVGGLFLGYGVPVITGNVFHFLMPDIWNITYLLALVGMYRIIAFGIAYNRRGRNPQKYYKKLVSSSMMKFQGKQTVRNMLVIALLIGASLFALSFVPMTMLSTVLLNDANPTDFALHYILSMDEVTKEDIYTLAEEHQIEFTKYDQLTFTRLIGSGVQRDFDEAGRFTQEYSDKHLFSEFVSESDYNRAMNASVSVPVGKYILLLQPETAERIWVKFNDLDLVTNPDTGETMPLAFDSTREDHSLARGEIQRYIINNEDYAAINTGISEDHKTLQILFNVAEPKNSYPFAQELFQLFLDKAPPELGRMSLYDDYQHSLAIEEGREYSYGTPVELKGDNPALMGNWKYYPTMKSLFAKTFLREFAVKLLLFVYVAIICLSAVGVIAYTRSISVGLSNKMLFEDLKKLGANNKYITKTITSQLNKIFMLPTIIGSGIILAYLFFMSFGNDGQFTGTELVVYVVNLAITLCMWVYLYIVYRASLKKVKKIVGVV